MTQKELAYLEDAIMHEQSIIGICEDTINNIDDSYLMNYMKKELRRHTNTHEYLIKKLEEKSNE
jgi:hypothetical protein